MLQTKSIQPSAMTDDLANITQRILKLKRRATRDIVEIGRLLAEAQQRIGNRARFVKWLEEEVEFSEDTAHRWMAVAARGDLAVLDLRPSCAYLLAGAPEGAAEEVAGLLASGEQVTVRQTYEIASRHCLTALVERGIEQVTTERHPDRIASLALGVLHDLSEATANPALRDTAVALLRQHGDMLTQKANIQGSADGVLSDLGVTAAERYPQKPKPDGVTLKLYDDSLDYVRVVAWISDQAYEVCAFHRNGNGAVDAIQRSIIGMLGHTYGLQIEPRTEAL